MEFGSTRNGAETANEYAGFVDYSLGYHYRFPQVLSGLKVLTGASARLSGGFIYNTRNSNNPVSGKADFDLNLSAMAIYNFRIKDFPLTLRYQAEIPFAGVLFSVHKGDAVVLYFSVVYTEACKGKKTGSVEYTAGEYDRIFGIHISALFQTSDGFLQNDDIHLLLYEYFPGSTGTQSDQNGTSQDPEPGI